MSTLLDQDCGDRAVLRGRYDDLTPRFRFRQLLLYGGHVPLDGGELGPRLHGQVVQFTFERDSFAPELDLLALECAEACVLLQQVRLDDLELWF